MLAIALLIAPMLASPLQAAAASTGPELVSVSNNNTAPDGGSSGPYITPDGRYVAFNSTADNLVSNSVSQSDASQNQIYVRDRTTGNTVLASSNNTGVGADQAAYVTGISPDGRYVTFNSGAHNLGFTNYGYQSQCFLKDLQQNTVVAIDPITSNSQPVSCEQTSPDASQFVMYLPNGFSSPGQPGAPACPQSYCIFTDEIIYNRLTGNINPIAIDSNGNYGQPSPNSNLWYSYTTNGASISADGKTVAFYSPSVLTPDAPTDGYKLYVRNIETNNIQRIASPVSSEAFVPVTAPTLSTDGKYLTYNIYNNSDNLYHYHLYARNLAAGSDTEIDATPSGDQSNGASYTASFSSDDNLIGFESTATNVTTNGSTATNHIFVRNMSLGKTVQVDLDANGDQANSNSEQPQITNDGSVVFYSYATNFDSQNAPSPQVYLSSIAVPPAAPTNLTAISPTHHVILNWDSVARASSYNVYRNGALIGSATTNSFVDQTVASDGTYSYYVTATANNIEGAHSNTLVITYDATPPVLGAATVNPATSTYGQSVALSVSVTDNLSGVVAGEYYDGMTDPGQGQGTVMTLTNGTLSATINALNPGKHTISYRAMDAAGNWTAPQKIQVIVKPLAATGLTAITPTNQSPSLHWTATTGAATYAVYRDGTNLGNTAATSYIDSSATPNATHTYYVVATTADGVTAVNSANVTVVYDTLAPTLSSPTATGNFGANIIGNGTETISATTSDNLSGVVSGEYFVTTTNKAPTSAPGTGAAMNYVNGKITASYNASVTGTYYVWMRSKDAAGNWSSFVTTNYSVLF